MRPPLVNAPAATHYITTVVSAFLWLPNHVVAYYTDEFRPNLAEFSCLLRGKLYANVFISDFGHLLEL